MVLSGTIPPEREQGPDANQYRQPQPRIRLFGGSPV